MEFPQIYFPDKERVQRVLRLANPNGGRLYVSTFCLRALVVLRDIVLFIPIKDWYDEFYITQEEFDGAKINYYEGKGYTIEFPIKYCHWDDSRFNRGYDSRVEDMAIELDLQYQRDRKVMSEREHLDKIKPCHSLDMELEIEAECRRRRTADSYYGPYGLPSYCYVGDYFSEGGV